MLSSAQARGTSFKTKTLLFMRTIIKSALAAFIVGVNKGVFFCSLSTNILFRRKKNENIGKKGERKGI